MYRQLSESAYKAASVDTETQVGLLLVAYEALALHLGRAGEAIEQQNIPARCEASNRALSLLAHIESWIVYLDDPSLSSSLASFYTWLRQQILLCQISQSRVQFESLAEVVLRLRSAWLEKRDQLLLGQQSSGRARARNDADCFAESANWFA